MEFLSLIISPIVENSIVPIKKHLGFLVSSTKSVKDMKEQLNDLNLTQRDIQVRKMRAAANNGDLSHHVLPWLKDVEEINKKAESIPNGGIRYFNVAKRYKAGKQSHTIMEQIEALKRRQSEMNWTNEQKSLAKVPSNIAPAPPDGSQLIFRSRELIFNGVLKSLQSNNESEKMIALSGMGGIGKTTMMEQLLEKVVKDSKTFDWVVKVVIGENSDPIHLQQAIAQYIGNDLVETDKYARADRLRRKFNEMSEGGKNKILVIMDDVWNEVDLKLVGLSPLPNALKLLFTSRDEGVCTRMGVRADSIFRVGILNDTEAKSLFFRIVGPYDDDLELQKIGEEIVLKCGGLPLALKTIANYLINNRKDAWVEALTTLPHGDLQDLDNILHKVFEISYNNLKTEDDKALFLLSGLFPDDFNIPIEDLMRYGWGLHLFTEVYTLAQARRRTNICVNKLIRANLLTESDRMGCVKMHDLVRAFVLSNFSKVKQASFVNHDNKLQQWLRKDGDEFYERILLKCTGGTFEFPTNFNYPNLSLLILMGGNNFLKFPDHYNESIKKLQVVSYESMHIPLLPITLEHSSTLRALCLRSCTLINGDISSLGSLSNLETLSFADCSIRRLPSTIGRLKKLKLLDLTGCVDLCIDDGVFKNLESLEELYMRSFTPIRFTKTNCEELENCPRGLSVLELEFFNNRIQPENVSFMNLERFRITIGCSLEYDKNYSLRNTLDLVANCNKLLECEISKLFNIVEELQLQVKDMNSLKDVSTNDVQFSNLKVLHVSKCSKLTYLFTSDVASGLNKLERLTISECYVLKGLVDENIGVEVIRFQKLNFMSLKNLPKMVSLCKNVIQLPEMVELRIEHLPNFTSIYPDHNNNAFGSLLNSKVVTPKLEKLHIIWMPNLKQIWPCYMSTIEKANVSALREIRLKKCFNMMNLFPSNPLPLVNNLEELDVDECAPLEVLFNIDFESASGPGKHRSRLRKISVSDSWNVKELWRIRGVNNSDIHIIAFSDIQSIEIEGCSRFTNIFTPITTNFDLRALTKYVTKQVQGDISYVPNVSATYPSYILRTFHHLQYLHLYDDRNVKEAVLFEIDGPSSRQLATIPDSHPPLLLPYLNIIELKALTMSHVWKCNWKALLIPQHQQPQFPFQNLAHINLQYCNKIKYLFSPFMAKYLSNLKKVEIDKCYGIEEVVSSRDDENEENTASTSSHQNTTFFPHLDVLNLSVLQCLNHIDDSDIRRRSNNITITIQDQSQSQVIGACWSLCQYPRKIFINTCHALSSLIPWYAVGQMKKLQELKVERCNRMTEVFESESTINDISIVVVPQLSNLIVVSITECDLLPHIFTFSTLESLKQLNKLIVKRCKAIQVIVSEEKDNSSEVVVFPRLKILELDHLPNLEAFFLGKNEFRWPSLDYVMINDCPRLRMFTCDVSKTPKLTYIHTSLGKHSLGCGQTSFPSSSNPTISIEKRVSFHDLIELNIQSPHVGTVIPSHALLQLQMLEVITVKSCYKVKEVFEVALEGRNNGGFSESQSQTVVQIPNLKQVTLKWAYDLKYLWQSNKWMVLEFPNLTTMSIYDCCSLEHVFTCSMVGSLVQLEYLHVSHCKNIEVIVKEECEARVNTIYTLPRLKTLKLENLPSVKGFCLGNEAFSWPLLDTLQISNCPEIEDFTKGYLSTPKLKVMDTTFGTCDIQGDLKSFIRTKQEEIRRQTT